MIERVLGFIEQWNMVGPGDMVIAGVSGGADSVCLCLVLQELSARMGFCLHVVHVEHGIRGEASRRDAAFVEDLCARRALPFVMCEENVPEFAKEHHMSVEEAARLLRYWAFARAAAEAKKDARPVRVALAHHMEDNAETMLLQLVRGTGLDGLCGMQPVRTLDGVTYIRPFLETGRCEIEEFLKARGQNYCSDATNSELAYSRNRIRHRVMPELAAVNAQAVLHMNQAAGRLAELRDYIDCEADRAYGDVVGRSTVCERELADAQESACERETADAQRGGEIKLWLRRDILEKLPQVLMQRVIHRAIAEAAGARRDIAAVHIRAVQELLSAQSGRQIDLPCGVVARREYERILLWRARRPGEISGAEPGRGAENLSEAEREAENMPGAQEVWITAEMLADCAEHGTAATVFCGGDGAQIALHAFSYDGNPLKISSKMYTKWFDYDKIKDGFAIRTRQKGDYIVLDEAGHRKKLERYFIDQKLPQGHRERIPLLTRESEVLWVIGGRMGRSGMVTEGTRTIIEVVYRGGVEDGLQQKT